MRTVCIKNVGTLDWPPVHAVMILESVDYLDCAFIRDADSSFVPTIVWTLR